MKIASVLTNGRPALAALVGEDWVDLSSVDASLGTDVGELLGSPDWRDKAESALSSAAPFSGEIVFRPTVPRPSKFLCLGLNDHNHAREAGYPVPEVPDVFVRVPESLVGHGQAMVCPPESNQFDYEVELAVIIGKGGRRIAPADALDHVAGYTVFNDGTLRDYQLRTSQWTLGKNFPRTGALGPALVTADELPKGASGLTMTTRVGEEILQQGNTESMIFGVREALALLSRVFEFHPGDVVAFGTPAGVGVARKPQRWMRPGETCTVSIDQIGELTNPIQSEQKSEHSVA